MFLTPEVLALQILNLIFFVFATIAVYFSIKIFFNWDISSSSQSQYRLEKQSYLTSVIIKYLLLFKIPIFVFFIFTLDKLSNIISGAMCAAGIVDATNYGSYLLVLKIINLYLFGFWLILHAKDVKHEQLPYTKQKFGIFIFIYLLFIVEILIEFLMFKSIDINQLVLCCGTLFSNSSSSYISLLFTIEPYIIVSIFYANFALLLFFAFYQQRELFAFSNVLFLITSIISLILFFGTYIYELPTHHCPFCFLQYEYYYVGYLLYALLFIGSFYGILSGFVKESDDEKNFQSKENKNVKISLIFTTLYVVVITLYPIVYYIRNGVWL